jgi:hypothetical protein
MIITPCKKGITYIINKIKKEKRKYELLQRKYWYYKHNIYFIDYE